MVQLNRGSHESPKIMMICFVSLLVSFVEFCILKFSFEMSFAFKQFFMQPFI